MSADVERVESMPWFFADATRASAGDLRALFFMFVAFIHFADHFCFVFCCRVFAEAMLINLPPNSFLVRASSQPNCYALSQVVCALQNRLLYCSIC
jgi:hypothetical protein